MPANGPRKSPHQRPARAPRVTLNQRATLVTSDGTELEVVVTDVSVRGFRIQPSETFCVGENIMIGERVVLGVERRDDMRGEIVWASACDAGAAFAGQ